MNFDNLKANEFDLTKGVKSQGWEEFFNCLKGMVYLELVKQFWIFAKASKLQVNSYVLGHKINISDKSISKLLNHDGFRKWCFDLLAKKIKLNEIVEFIFHY